MEKDWNTWWEHCWNFSFLRCSVLAGSHLLLRCNRREHLPPRFSTLISHSTSRAFVMHQQLPIFWWKAPTKPVVLFFSFLLAGSSSEFHSPVQTQPAAISIHNPPGSPSIVPLQTDWLHCQNLSTNFPVSFSLQDFCLQQSKFPILPLFRIKLEGILHIRWVPAESRYI